MVHSRKKFRARGIYLPTGRESWLTTVWRNTKKEAEEDKDCYGHNYTDVKIKVK